MSAFCEPALPGISFKLLVSNSRVAGYMSIEKSTWTSLTPQRCVAARSIGQHIALVKTKVLYISYSNWNRTVNAQFQHLIKWFTFCAWSFTTMLLSTLILGSLARSTHEYVNTITNSNLVQPTSSLGLHGPCPQAEFQELEVALPVFWPSPYTSGGEKSKHP